MSDLERKMVSRLTKPADMKQAWDLGLREHVFVEPMYRMVFEHIVKYWQDSRQTTTPTFYVLAEDFPGVPLEEDVEETTAWLVDTLQSRHITNQAQEIIRDAALTLNDDPRGSMSKLWQEAHATVQSVEPRQYGSDMTNVDARRERYLNRFNRIEGGMTIGLPELDLHTGGLLPGELAAVGAYTKTGKSFWLAHAAVRARRLGHIPLLFTLEQDIDEMEDRIDAFMSGVSYDRLSKGLLQRHEIDQLHAAQDDLHSNGPIYVRRPPYGERTVTNMVSMARQIGADYLLIDQLSWMDATKSYRGEKATTQMHADLIRDLKGEISNTYAGEIPCMLAVQQNRKSQEEPRGTHRQRGQGALENFANTSMIEQTVDIAIGLWRSREMRNNRSMQLDIMGSRRCDEGSWMLGWNLVDRTEIVVRNEIQ